MLLPLMSIRLQESPPHDQWFDRPISFALTLAQSSIYSLLDGGESLISTYLNIIHTNRRNEELELENSELKAQLTKMQEYKIENDHFRILLSLKGRSPMTLVAAEVISSSSDLVHHAFWINKGADHGVQIGQAVLSKESIIGSVIRVLGTRSQVLLVTDRFSVVDGLVARTRAKGIVEGIGSGNALFRSFDKLTDLVIGDEIVSTGVDQAFPRGIVIARVRSLEVDRESGLPRVILDAHFEPARVDHVFIATSGSDVDHSFWNQELLE